MKLTIAVVSLCALTSTFATSARADGLVVGALGDSISAGFDAVRLGDNRELSWATGTSPDINSISDRLAAKYNTTVTSYNEAIAGSVASDLGEQITRLLPHNPDYVTIDIGANDVCTWDPATYQTALAAFTQTLKADVDRILTALPHAKIILAPVPDIHNLWQVAVGQSGCQSRWDTIGMCHILLSSSSTDADRQAFVVRWQAINDAIDQLAASYPTSIVHDGTVAHAPFAWSDVSQIDCFHPSTAGQNLLAEKAWGMFEAAGY